MRRLGNTKSFRIAAGLLGLLVLAAALFSVFFIAAEADHDCTGEDCSICACIRLCTEYLNQLRLRTIILSQSVLPALAVFPSLLVFSALLTGETPVGRKVKLNN